MSAAMLTSCSGHTGASGGSGTRIQRIIYISLINMNIGNTSIGGLSTIMCIYVCSEYRVMYPTTYIYIEYILFYVFWP